MMASFLFRKDKNPSRASVEDFYLFPLHDSLIRALGFLEGTKEAREEGIGPRDEPGGIFMDSPLLTKSKAFALRIKVIDK